MICLLAFLSSHSDLTNFCSIWVWLAALFLFMLFCCSFIYLISSSFSFIIFFRFYFSFSTKCILLSSPFALSFKASKSTSYLLNLSWNWFLNSKSFFLCLTIACNTRTLILTSFLFVERRFPQSGNPNAIISIYNCSNKLSNYSRSLKSFWSFFIWLIALMKFKGSSGI